MARDPRPDPVGDDVTVEPVAAREALDWDSAADPSSGLVVPVPDGWESTVDPAEIAVITLAAEGSADNDFRPNVTVTVERPPAELADLHAYSRELLAGLFRYLTDVHVVSADPEPFGGHDGRRVVSGHRQGPFTLVTEQYWSIAPSGVATVLTGTCTIEQYRWASGVFEQVALGTTVATTLPGSGPDGGPA